MAGGGSKTIVLLACSSRKRAQAAPAAELYQGNLFRASLAWAKARAPDAIFILSARYGLLEPDRVIEPYDLTLNRFSEGALREWSATVLDALRRHADPDRDRFVFLAGERYRRHLLPALKNAELPLAGMRYGEQVSWLQRSVATESSSSDQAAVCHGLHQFAASLPRLRFPIPQDRLPAVGIYLLFEAGERAHGTDRIVRIGTHTGQGNLRARLREHFEVENKDRSVFRKIGGRALLARDGDDARLAQWNLDLTTRKARERYEARIDRGAMEAVERRVSEWMRGARSFAVVEVGDRQRRLELESALIATVAACPGCGPSGDWPGGYSPIPAIAGSGLWQTQHLQGRPLDRDGLERLKAGQWSAPQPASQPDSMGKQTSAARSRRGRPGGRYTPLADYLEQAPDEVTLSFRQIEQILQSPLPASAYQYPAWWANQSMPHAPSQALAWTAAGFRVDGHRLGRGGWVRFRRVGGIRRPARRGLEDRGPVNQQADSSVRQAATHGGRTRDFHWWVADGRVHIESESGMRYEYPLAEVLTVLGLLHAHFKENWFPLTNNVAKLYQGRERYGLGAAIHQQRPGDTSHAQGASYLGVVLEQAGILEWNRKARQIQWRISRMPDDLQELRSWIAGTCAGD